METSIQRIEAYSFPHQRSTEVHAAREPFLWDLIFKTFKHLLKLCVTFRENLDLYLEV